MADKFCPQCVHSVWTATDPPRLRCQLVDDLTSELSLCMVQREDKRACGPEGVLWEAKDG